MANTAVNIFGFLRRGQQQVPAPININPDGDVLVQQTLPPYAEMTAQGQGWQVMNVLAIAGLVVRPTTVCMVEIWNGYAASGPSLVIEDLLALHLVSTAVQNAAGIWAYVTPTKAAPSAGANVVVYGTSGKSYAGPVVVGLGTTVVDTPGNGNGWFPYGASYYGPNTATPGGSWRAPVDGKIIVPPQRSLALTVVASIVGDTFQVGAHWYEKQITLL